METIKHITNKFIEMIYSNETQLYPNYALVGTTGNGKSTTGNTVSGHPYALLTTHSDAHRAFPILTTKVFVLE